MQSLYGVVTGTQTTELAMEQEKTIQLHMKICGKRTNLGYLTDIWNKIKLTPYLIYIYDRKNYKQTIFNVKN